jgi:GT2 family glycosyltransferase
MRKPPMSKELNTAESERTANRISVVIPHLNQPEALARCLASLRAGREVPDEIVVVDNGSRELPREICAAAGARLLREAEPGPGPARNRGVAEATGEILAFIDADCLADHDWIAAIRAAFTDPAAEILGGDVRIARADPDRVTMLEAYESVYAYRMDRYIAEQGFTGTGNLAVRRHVLEAVGPFRGLDVAEDRDWGQRARRAGHDLRYVPGMRVYHPARATFAELARKWDRHVAHDYAAFRVRPGGRLLWAGRTLAMALSPPAELPRILASDRISGTGPRLKAWACLARVRLYRARVMARLLLRGDAAALSRQWNRG